MLLFFLAGCGQKHFIPISWESTTSQLYTYEDLWIRIITSPSQISWEVLKRHHNIIYNGQAWNIWDDYMEVFFKNPHISLEEEITNKHLSKWCRIETGILTKEYGIFSSMKWFYIVYITSEDWNLASNGEIFDKEFPENPFNIAFVMDSKKPDKYYKFSYGDCAPGPCSIFGKIEFF